MGAALFDDNRWHVLMEVDRERLADYRHGCPTEDYAKHCCYVGIDMFLSLRGVNLPLFEELVWTTVEDTKVWIDNFCSKPVWKP
jgi:hypothetical protein